MVMEHSDSKVAGRSRICIEYTPYVYSIYGGQQNVGYSTSVYTFV